MRQLRIVALLLVLVATACGGDDAADTTVASEAGGGSGGSGSGNDSDSDDPNALSADFDVSSLPDNFPSELVPPAWTAGQATDILGPFVVNFERDVPFAEAVEYYEAILGPAQVLGDPGEQVAQWTSGPIWIVSVLDGDPVLIGFTDIAE